MWKLNYLGKKDTYVNLGLILCISRPTLPFVFFIQYFMLPVIVTHINILCFDIF